MLLLATGWRLAGKYRVPFLYAGGLLGVVFAALAVSQERQWRDDSTVLTVARQLGPHNATVARSPADIHVQMAVKLDDDGRCNEALPVFEQVTEEFPRDWYAWAGQADCFYQLNNLTEAEKSLHRAAELSQRPQVIQQWQELRARMGLPSAVPPE